MNEQNNAKTIVVAGDVTIDWNIARIHRTEGYGAGMDGG